MSRVPDKDLEHAAPAQPEPGPTEPAGRVEVDSRGRNVWRWARDVIESTSVLLKRLENKDLALEPTQKVPIMRGAEAAPKGSKQGAKPVASNPGVAKPGTSEPAASKSAARHPALQRGRGNDGGGGFDPYNTR
jgi:hypothetical protein